MYNRIIMHKKRFRFDSLIFEFEYVQKSNLDKSLDDLTDKLNTHINNNHRNFLEAFNGAKESYNTLTKLIDKDKEKENFKESIVEDCYAPVVVDLLGVYGVIKNKLINHFEGINDKRINIIYLDRKAVYERAQNILVHRINQLINAGDDKEDSLRRTYTLLGEIVYNHALYALKIKKGSESLHGVTDLKINGKSLKSILKWLGNYYLLDELKILKFDYLVKKKSILNNRYSFLSGLLNSITSDLNKISDPTKRRRIRDILETRKNLLKKSCFNKTRHSRRRR